jgi:ribosome maturation factor RimP
VGWRQRVPIFFSTGLNMEPLPSRIEQQLRTEIGQRGLILLEVGIRGHGGTSVLEVIVDSEHGPTLDELTDLARWTSALLDQAESDLPSRYRLEVTTPGLDRPLEHLWQFRKNIGRLLKLVVVDHDGKRSTGLFRLLHVHDAALTLEPEQAKGRSKRIAEVESLTIPLESIVRATVEPQL